MHCIEPKGLFPCGKCEACRSKKMGEWVFRLKQELKYSSDAHFITLTYDEEHLPPDGSLNKVDCQLFLKRFRKRIEPNQIRYFLVGEYGSETYRPHYHMLLFNYPKEYDLHTDLLNSWNAGAVHIGNVTGRSISYCVKYLYKVVDLPADLEPHFMLSSRRPGIGAEFLTEEQRAYLTSPALPNRVVDDGVTKILPRYYRDKLDLDFFQKGLLKDRLRRYQTKKAYETIKNHEESGNVTTLTDLRQQQANDFRDRKQKFLKLKNKL